MSVIAQHKLRKRLIAEVQKLPVLWDPSHEQYSSDGAQKTAWRWVCASIYNNYYLMDVIKQNTVLKEIKKLWMSIQTQHRIRVEERGWNSMKRNRRKPDVPVFDYLAFLLPTYKYVSKKYCKTNLENFGENDDSTLKPYLIIEVKEELPESDKTSEIDEVNNETKYIKDFDIVQTKNPRNEKIFSTCMIATQSTIKTEIFDDIQMPINDTYQDATINSTIKGVSTEVTETATTEVFDKDLEISESMIKEEIIDDVKVDISEIFQDITKSEIFLQQEVAQREFNNELDDNDAFFAFLQSSVNKLNDTQKLNFRIEALQLLARIKSS